MPKREPEPPEPEGPNVTLYGDPSTDAAAARKVHSNAVAGSIYATALQPQLGKVLQGVNLDQSAMTYIDDTIQRMAPRDPLEEMLVIQAAMIHARVLHLTSLANQQDTWKGVQTINEYADRASNTFRRQMLALAEYRKPPRGGDSFTAIKQANIAQQQVVMNGENTNTENATNEQGDPSHATSPTAPRETPQTLSPQPGGSGIVESIGTPHEAVGAVHRPEDTRGHPRARPAVG